MALSNCLENKTKNEFTKAFIYDIIFPNPKIVSSNKEFCDILIDFFNDLVIIQCKECLNSDPRRVTKRTIVDGLNQLRSSVNRAKEKNIEISMFNEIQGRRSYDFKNLNKIYPILIVNEKTPFISYNFLRDIYPELKKLTFIPVIITFDDLKFMIQELDTPKDFFNYLEKREEIIRTDKIFFENEIELLSYYLLTMRTFEQDNFSEKPDVIFLNNIKSAYREGKISEIIKKRNELDYVSYWVDDLLQRLFLSNEKNYLKIAKELSNLSRFERRSLAEASMEKCGQAFKENRDTYRLFKLTEDSEVAFVFYFTKKPLDMRNERLGHLCMTARYKLKVKKIIGIAHEPLDEKFSKSLSWDSFCFVEGDFYPNEEEIKKILPQIWGDAKIVPKKEFPEEIL